MIFDGQQLNSTLLMVLGSSGGPKIITSVVQVIINHLYLGLDMFQSVVNPRVHDQLLYHSSAGVGFEDSTLVQGPLIETPERTKSALRKRHQKLFSLDYTGTCQSISVDLDTDKLSAVSDIRKLGMNAGY